MKKTKALFAATLLLLSSAASTSLFADTFFSGNTAIVGKFSNQKARSFDPALNMDGFLAAQFDFSNSFLVRGEFSVQTGDIYDDLFSETESIFRIDELSCTYIKPFYGISHFFSAFLGTFEPIGNQSYLQHMLGIKPHASPLTETYLSLNGCNVYDFYGLGAGYSIRFNTVPVATGLLIYKNNRNATETAQLNFDWRIGGSAGGITFDCTAGFGAPMNTKNQDGEDVVLLIDTIYMHTGIDLLIGNSGGKALLLQMGFEHLPIRSKEEEKKINAKDLYLIVEPRFKIGDAHLNLSFYNLPTDKIKKTMILEDNLGVNLCLFGDRFTRSGKEMQIGLHGTVSFKDKDLKDFDSELMDAMKIKISPFVKFNVLGGEINAILQVNMSRFLDSESESIKFNLGYKKSL